jgi:1-acyl-sn-glycerol-3-phosphate acyltransferase
VTAGRDDDALEVDDLRDELERLRDEVRRLEVALGFRDEEDEPGTGIELRPQAAVERRSGLPLGPRRIAGVAKRRVEGGARAFGTTVRDVVARRRRGEFDEDDFAFDDRYTELLLPVANFFYDRWWRVETYGVEHVPARGAALLAANHAGVLPLDGAMIKTAILREHPQPRHVRMLAMDWLMRLPYLSPFLRRTGQTLACKEDALELLRRGELVGSFPEGANGTGKHYSERYRLGRFGRGGFVRIAIETGAPIVPVAVVGSEEIYPMLYDVRPVAKLIRSPYFPITPLFPWTGPFGFVPLPSKWVIEFCEPIRTDHLRPEDAQDQGLVLRLADRVRDVIQERVDANLQRRGSAFGE